MTFSRARFLSSASTTHQRRLGDVGRARTSRPWPGRTRTQRLRASRSIGLSFQRLSRVLEPRLEAPLLLVVADREPVLDQHDAAADQHALELGAGAQELPVLVVGAEAHHALDAGAVVPGPVEQDHLARGRQVGDVALEVPLRPSRRRSGRGRATIRATRGLSALGDALDRPALAGGVAALEDHRRPGARGPDLLLLLDQLDLEPRELLLVVVEVDLARGLRRFLDGQLACSASGHGREDRPAAAAATTPSGAGALSSRPGRSPGGPARPTAASSASPRPRRRPPAARSPPAPSPRSPRPSPRTS